MDHRLLALKIFNSKSDLSDIGGKGEIDIQELVMTIVLKFIDVLEGIGIIIVGLFAMKFAKIYIQRIQTTHERQRTALNLLEKIVSGFIIVISITLGLKIIGLDLTLLVSVLTLGLSFGLRDVIKNYIAGLLILFKSPFEIGDVVKIRSFTGKVVKIEFQAITLTTFDQKEITIHNKDILTQPITNFSKNGTRRLEIDFKLGYGSDLARAIAIVDRILQNDTHILKKPKFSIRFKHFGDTGTTSIVRFWVQRPCNMLQIRTDIALKIQESLDEVQLLAPYSREVGLEAAYSMTEPRKQRLSAFYGMPILADIASATITAVNVATVPSANGTEPVEEFADADEPE